MSDRQPSEEPEEQVDLEGDDDGMDDDDAGYRRRPSLLALRCTSIPPRVSVSARLQMIYRGM
uniref:Uncharacterized protein n=1 Tax=Zea mays TaxID=4577 RepID=B6U8F3_MAIZE|nr:hypothetical protein [Zea mays]